MSTIQVGQRQPKEGEELLFYHRAKMTDCIESLWSVRACANNREWLEPILAEMACSGDYEDAADAIRQAIWDSVWNDETDTQAIEDLRTILDWTREYHNRWEELNRAELAEFERRMKK